MNYKALYRKYRPKKFADISGQDVIVSILKNSIKTQKIGRAYIFNGPRGTGKTSTAKILAQTVNCLHPIEGEKCDKCDSCVQMAVNDIDIIEIDAASNNGIDEIREIRNNAKLLPNVGKYKIYIIDEVHMLSTGAFNALLKTLEEPPKHVIFILATTELDKIPLTILSRCQNFEFKKIPQTDLKKRLKYIISCENISIEDEAIDLIINVSDGGLRDAINLLDQASGVADNIIKVDDICDISGIVTDEKYIELYKKLLTNDVKEILRYIENLSNSGKNYKIFSDGFILFLRDMLLENILIDDNKNNKFIINLIKRFLKLSENLKNSINQKILFEVEMLDLINVSEIQNIDNEVILLDNHIKKNLMEERIKNNKSNSDKPEQAKISTINQRVIEIRVNNCLALADKKILKKLAEKTNNLSMYISNKKYNNIALLLQNGILTVASPHHLIYIYNSESDATLFNNNISKIESLIVELFEQDYKVVALSSENWKKEKKQYMENLKHKIKYEVIEEPNFSADLIKDNTEIEETALNIFGEDIIKTN